MCIVTGVGHSTQQDCALEVSGFTLSYRSVFMIADSILKIFSFTPPPQRLPSTVPYRDSCTVRYMCTYVSLLRSTVQLWSCIYIVYSVRRMYTHVSTSHFLAFFKQLYGFKVYCI